MQVTSTWRSVATAPEGVPILTKIHDTQGERNVQVLTKRGNLWWADGMYVYYTPTHWTEKP